MKNLIFILLTVFAFGCGFENAAVQQQYENAGNHLAEQAINKYNMAIENNDLETAFVQAGMAAGFYLEAQDNENYKKWRAVELELQKQYEQQLMNSVNQY